MRTIALFNDGSTEATNASEFALSIAQKVKADLLIFNLCQVSQNNVLAGEALVGTGTMAVKEAVQLDLISYLADTIGGDDFRPVISELDVSSYTDKEVYDLVISKGIWMMVKGIETHITHQVLSEVNSQVILNHVACPLLLIPDNYKKKDFENITYALDMRYCRSNVVRFLSELARCYEANLVIEHFSVDGLPHLGNEYGRSLFQTEVLNKISYPKVFFNNIKERDLGIAVDVMVNDLHADLLALVNHRFHFEELFGMSIKNVLPEHLSVPVIIFPL